MASKICANCDILTKRQSLFSIVSGLRYFGLGAKVTRKTFKFPDTYWIITSVKLSPDNKSGEISGRMYWRGKPKKLGNVGITARNHEWALVDTPDYSKFNGKSSQVFELVGGRDARIKE